MHWVLAQSNTSAGEDIGALIVILVYVAILALVIAGLWRLFTKAGQPGWACLIPLYNIYILLKIVGRPWWWLLLMFIPIVSLVAGIVVILDLAKSFGKGVGFAIGMILLGFIFIPVLGFGNAQYQGPAAAR